MSRAWALWPMPNPAGLGLPHPHDYTVMNFSGDFVVRDNVTGLTWKRDETPTAITWDAARAYCEGLVFAFQDDWRLPTRIELASLVDFTRDDPAWDPTGIPSPENGNVWTSSTTPIDRARVFVVQSFSGATVHDSMTTTNRARCVR